MKAVVRLTVAVLVLALAAPAVALAETPSLADIAAGRIRYLEGPGIEMTFSNQTVQPEIDYLVLVGATFHTNDGRIELQTVNGDLFWVDRQTNFYFEASDRSGDQTSLFLARGAFVVKTEKPFTLITGAGSVYFPAGGVYGVSKEALGVKKTKIAVLSGQRPEVVKRATLFSKIRYVRDADADLVAWMQQRLENWQQTLRRASISSHVDKMPPMVAYTDSAGKLHWQRVTSVRPIYQMADLVVSNFFLWPSPSYLRVMSLLPPYPSFWSDYEVAAWIVSSRYNSVRWAWNVEVGWHAEWYYDPLAGFGAEFSTAAGFGPESATAQSVLQGRQFRWRSSRSSADLTQQFFRGSNWDWFSGPSGGVTPSEAAVATNRLTDPDVEASAVPVAVPTHGTGFQQPLRRNSDRPTVVRLTRDARSSERLRTDPGLRTIRRARRLDVQRADIALARARTQRSAAFRSTHTSRKYAANTATSGVAPASVSTSSPATAGRSSGSAWSAPFGRTGRPR